MEGAAEVQAAHETAPAGPSWQQIVAAIMRKYNELLDATPLDRLHVDPPGLHHLPGGHDRLAQCVTNMLLKVAIPKVLSVRRSFRAISSAGRPGGNDA